MDGLGELYARCKKMPTKGRNELTPEFPRSSFRRDEDRMTGYIRSKIVWKRNKALLVIGSGFQAVVAFRRSIR